MNQLQHYPFQLPPLPYDYAALEPYIDSETMYYHHDKHFATYIENLNKALKNYPEYQQWSLDHLLTSLPFLPVELQTDIRNNGGGTYNHALYFALMSPNKSAPTGKLLEAIQNDLGGLEELKDSMKKAGLGQFGSGFAWLVLDETQRLHVMALPNQDNPLSQGLYPILPMDVWEHAYYLKYKNERGNYIDNWFHVINWDQVAERYENAIM